MTLIKEHSIYVRTEFVGFHQWTDAPEQVKFLRDLHRHIFGVRVKVSVTHSNRDVEFFTLKEQVESYITSCLLPHLEKNPGLSCEMLASLVGDYLARCSYNVLEVEVNEDGENGGIVTYL